MLILQNISYTHPDRTLLFDNINLTVNNHDKIALVGDNGAGKSTLLKIIAGALQPSGGRLHVDTTPVYIPQVFGQYDQLNIAQALGADKKLHALNEILNGYTTEEHFNTLNEDWTIEERCREALQCWQLDGLNLLQKMGTLSGGQKTKVFLAGLSIHQPAFILLDEPGNHLDLQGRWLLYNFIQTTASTLITVSHDRKLLNLFDTICELDKTGIVTYGGNYDFYAAQKQLKNIALQQGIQSTEKALRKAKEKERQTLERQQRSDSRGKNKQEKAGVAKIMMNTYRNKAENSTSKAKAVHAEKITGIAEDLRALRLTLPDTGKMKLDFDDSSLHNNKILFTATGINFSYHTIPIWPQNLDLQIMSSERIALKGKNGSGKTTLLNLITGKLQPEAGSVYRAADHIVYIDQDYSLLNNTLTVYEQAQTFNTAALQEHETRSRLTRFLFTREDWDKPCRDLSGGERMRLLLCCLTISNHPPDMIILDEPTNNLDIQSIGILTAAVNEYKGTMIVVLHDETFLEEIGVTREIVFP